jgi:hypothetical protein
VQLPKAVRQVVTVEHTGDEGVSSLDGFVDIYAGMLYLVCRSCRLENSCAVVPTGTARSDRSAAESGKLGWGLMIGCGIHSYKVIGGQYCVLSQQSGCEPLMPAFGIQTAY